MSARTVTILGFVVIAVGSVVLELMARRPFPKVARLDQTMRFVLRTRSGRIGLIAVWAWSGIHFFG